MKRAAALGFSIPAIAAFLAQAGPASDVRFACASAVRPRRQDATPGGTLREGYDHGLSRMDPINTSWYDYAFSEHPITIDPDTLYVLQIIESWDVSKDLLAHPLDPDQLEVPLWCCA